MCVYVSECVHACHTYVEVRGTLAGVVSPHHMVPGNLGSQSWSQALFLLSHLPDPQLGSLTASLLK